MRETSGKSFEKIVTYFLGSDIIGEKYEIKCREVEDMKKRISSLFLISAMLVSIMGGCQNVAPADTEKQEEEKKNGVVTLKVWGSEGDQDLIKTLCEEFAAANSGTKFEFVYEAVEEGNCRDTVLDAVSDAADVFTFADDQLAGFAASGAIDPVVEVDTIKSQNVEGSVNAATINGVLYAYPMTADNGYFMYYDKRVFEEKDLESLDSMLAAAQKANKQIFMDVTSGWYNYSFFGGTGLTIGLNDDGISNYCTWNSVDNAIKGTDVLSAMLAVCQNPGFTKNVGLSLVDGIKDGTYCAGVSGVWDAAALTEILGDNLGATKLPTYTVAGQQVQMASFAGYKLIGVNSYSANREWAHKLAEWLTNETSQIKRFEMRALGPSNVKAAASDNVLASIALVALNKQAPFSKLQRVGGAYWGPSGDIGNFAMKNNPNHDEPQAFLDRCVENITKSNGQ